MTYDVVTPAALLRSFFPRQPLDDVFGNWTVDAIEDLFYRSTANVTHNVTGERFEVIVRKTSASTHVPFQKVPDSELRDASQDL